MEPLPPEQQTDPRLRAYREVTDARLSETDARLAQGAKVLALLKTGLALAVALVTATAGVVGWVTAHGRASAEVVAEHLEQHVEESDRVHARIADTQDRILDAVLERPQHRTDGGTR